MSPLNDLRGYTQRTVFFQMLPFGVMAGALVALWIDGDNVGLALALLAVGIVAMVAWGVGSVAATRRLDRALRTEVEHGSAEIVNGTVSGIAAPARVVRRRSAKRNAPYVLGTPLAPGAPADTVVLTALLPSGPRRVAALVPVSFGLARTDAPAAVVVHPARHEVAVVDARVTPEQVAAIADDPRWRSTPLPTDRSVLGGSRGITLIVLTALAGAVVGLALSGVVVLLVG